MNIFLEDLIEKNVENIVEKEKIENFDLENS